MRPTALDSPAVAARRIVLGGRVQGVGLRPAVARLAEELGLRGEVRNVAEGVVVRVEGTPPAVARFAAELWRRLPPEVQLGPWRSEPAEVQGFERFAIATSDAQGALAVAVPPDRASCPRCLAEAADASDRRFDYGFGSCVDCGPRYSIIAAMPYDRAATTMQAFAPCPACAGEFAAPPDRRFHAQTLACPTCGPEPWLVDGQGRTLARGPGAFAAAAAALAENQIVALRGLGGYQLLVRADAHEAVARLRQRKGRRAKPLAVMVADSAAARQLGIFNERELASLTSSANPIVVVRRRDDAAVAAEVSPGNPTLGVMLPTTPLHARLLARCPFPLVATSGNREGEPLEFEPDSAEKRLAGIADLWLHHNRPIARPIDDSVLRVAGGRTCILRLARGLAPLTLPAVGETAGPIVALGGEQKATVALYNGAQIALGPHLGDLANVATCERWEAHLASWLELYRVAQPRWVHDLHPEYFTTRWAEGQAGPRQAVQHHHAHLASVLLAEQALDQTALALTWDGAGYGPDGLLWGGECLLGNARSYRRIGHLRPFPLLGGEQAVRQPWRLAVALLRESAGAERAAQCRWPQVASAAVAQLVAVAGRLHLHVRSTSIGRLFDAVAAIVLGRSHADFEGQAAIELEHAADPGVPGAYDLPWDRVTGEIDWRPMIRAIDLEMRHGQPSSAIAMRFHRALAQLAARLAGSFPEFPLVTAGGVFQNALLCELIEEALLPLAPRRLRGEQVPPGDGGLALGQLAVALATAGRNEDRSR